MEEADPAVADLAVVDPAAVGRVAELAVGVLAVGRVVVDPAAVDLAVVDLAVVDLAAVGRVAEQAAGALAVAAAPVQEQAPAAAQAEAPAAVPGPVAVGVDLVWEQEPGRERPRALAVQVKAEVGEASKAAVAALGRVVVPAEAAAPEEVAEDGGPVREGGAVRKEVLAEEEAGKAALEAVPAVAPAGLLEERAAAEKAVEELVLPVEVERADYKAPAPRLVKQGALLCVLSLESGRRRR